MKTTIYFLFITFLAWGCSNASNEQTADASFEPRVMDHYMELKDALVRSDTEAAQRASDQLAEVLETQQAREALKGAAKTISETGNLEAQRIAFKTITDGMIEILKTSHPEETLYVQYCPMAFDNTGAKWLSTSTEILNPYFGDRMLKCGRVEAEID